MVKIRLSSIVHEVKLKSFQNFGFLNSEKKVLLESFHARIQDFFFNGGLKFFSFLVKGGGG